MRFNYSMQKQTVLYKRLNESYFESVKKKGD